MRTGVGVRNPEVAGLPYVISGLVAAGGMAAAMSTADGLTYDSKRIIMKTFTSI